MSVAVAREPLPPNCVLPIYLPRADGSFGHHGTAIPVTFRGRNFLVTAAHVNDGDGYTDALMVAVTNKAGELEKLSLDSLCTVIPAGRGRGHDKIDLAVMVMPEAVARGRADLGFTFIGLDGWAEPVTRPGDKLLFNGYPLATQRFCPMSLGTWVEHEPVAIPLRQVETEEAAGLGFPLEDHLVGRFRFPRDHAKVDETKTPLVPAGMSGGAVWHSTDAAITFAGVVTRWNQAGHLIATRGRHLLPLITEAHARLR